jgi:hypothetical protein
VATTDVQLSDRFPRGTKASLSVLAGSVVQPGAPQKTTTADAKGVVRFTGCLVGAQYVVNVEGDGWTAQYAIQAKGPEFNEDAVLHRDGPEATARRLQADREAQSDAIREARKKDPALGSPAPGRTVVDNSPERKKPAVPNPRPGPRQDETSGPQRSDTPFGEGTPKDLKEPVPAPRQEDVPKRTRQRSSTETGTAARKSKQKGTAKRATKKKG